MSEFETCTSCGKEVPSYVAYCPHCQAKMTDQSGPVAPFMTPDGFSPGVNAGIEEYLSFGTVILGLMAIPMLVAGQILSFLALAGGAVFLIPAVHKKVTRKLNRGDLTWGERVFFAILIFIIAAFLNNAKSDPKPVERATETPVPVETSTPTPTPEPTATPTPTPKRTLPGFDVPPEADTDSSSSGSKKCSKGKPCGDTCIPRSHTCHQ